MLSMTIEDYRGIGGAGSGVYISCYNWGSSSRPPRIISIERRIARRFDGSSYTETDANNAQRGRTVMLPENGKIGQSLKSFSAPSL